MRLTGLVTALNPATVVALSISGRGSPLEARERPSLAQTYENLAALDVVNGTGCTINGDEVPEQRRADTDRSCANQQQQVDSALAQCIQLAKRAEQDAKDGSPTFQQYFKTNDANTRNRVAQSFAKIAAGCGHDGNQPIKVECTPNEPCFLPQSGNLELAAVATITSGTPGSIRLCRSAFDMPAGGRQRRQNQGQGCGNTLTNLDELFVHEMSHTTVATGDIAYGKQKSKQLDTDSSLENADNYALYAGDIAKNCNGAGTGNGNRPPNNGDDGDNESPNGGNGRPPTGVPGNTGGPSNRPPNNKPPTGGPSSRPPNNKPPTTGPSNDFPGFDNQIDNDDNFQSGGNNNNGPSNKPPTNGPSNNGPFNNGPFNNGPFDNGPSNNGPPNNGPDFDGQFSNNNNVQQGGNNNDFDLDPSIISEILGSNDFEVVPAGK
ncbi:Deuterolysin metalloprotease family protein [Metarhizium robertsii ARSEF 23]|uniref:Deuterolysin metalloprotease family protein n=1 Tax=Metarhizium robertsii (strain ARSEF 23 / ATCC MYA-3075) TaxID=655844 RepID=E9FB36_METRA|nr:Deuterolysin metalloprotease family protein [Metarhizium robertsii ARSEF 23]EFY95036.1 Deuterolysin metalloprotease family protein [Metarhizium robertsii ARSEF 23]